MFVYRTVSVFIITLVYLTGYGWTEVTPEVTSARTTPEPVIYCYDCFSSNPYCPGHSNLHGFEEGTQVVVANCTLDQKCFTRQNKLANTTHIYRGCTKVIGSNLPKPLPEDGCYDYKGDIFCLCSTDRCNRNALGEATGVNIDAHLKTASGGFRPPQRKRRGNKKTIVCNVCNSGKTGEENFACMPNRVADWSTTWKQNCSGRCITKTDFLNPDVGVYRECSDVWWKFPTPFAADGCYEWYGDTVCLCNYDLCNAYPIGRHNNVALDAHLHSPGQTGGGVTRTFSFFIIAVSLLARTFL